MEAKQLLKIADELAAKAHQGQKDKAGMDYIHHPRTVSAFCSNPKAKIAALLHDVLEDTEVQEAELRSLFGDEITDAVVLLTHAKEENYFDYVRRIKQNPIAREVKLADLKHNSDCSRLTEISEKDLRRIEKYQKAIQLLMQEE